MQNTPLSNRSCCSSNDNHAGLLLAEATIDDINHSKNSKSNSSSSAEPDEAILVERKKALPPSRLQQIYMTKDWWTMWIGLISFFLAVVITFVVPFERGGSSRVRYVIPQPMKWTYDPRDAWDLYNVGGTILLLWVFGLLYLLSLSIMDTFEKTSHPPKLYGQGFFGVCVISVVAFWIGTQNWCSRHGFGYAIWSILFGLIIGNTQFLSGGGRLKAVKIVAKDGEYFIKCSLVLLAVQFSIIGEFGLPAIGVAWGASPISLILSYVVGRKLFKMEIITSLLIAVGSTWCGASAISAIATVVSAPSKDVVACIGIVASGTVVFTFLQPYFAMIVGMDDLVAGAWIGGSIDQTGNVIASAAIVSEEATEVAGIVKIILNSGLSILATMVASWWQLGQRKNSNDEEDTSGDDKKKRSFSWLFLWDKFPKFVLGYFICSAILTVLIVDGTPEGDALPLAVHSMSRWWFSIAFSAIGINTNLVELWYTAKSTGVIKLYLISNVIDMTLSFLFAWWLFRDKVPWL